MKIKLAAACLVLGSFMVAVAAHAAEDKDTDRSHPMTYVKDSAITVKVKAKLAAAHGHSLKNVSVDTDNAGVVVLSGSVRSKKEMDQAVRIARRTEHVTAVTNNLEIKKDD